MAIKTYHVLKDMRHPLYRTRMLRAGQPLELDASTANLYKRLNVIGDDPPAEGAVPAMTTQNTGQTKPKRAPRKRAAKKAK